MAESNSIDKLFRHNISKDEFITAYSEIKFEQGTKSDNEELSIFSADMSNSLEAIYDTLDENHDNKIDENEFNKLKNYYRLDGENTLSEEDFSVLYTKTIDNIFSSYNSIESKTMYQDAIENGEQTTNVIGETKESAYNSQLAIQINTINELILTRKKQSDAKILQYQNKLNDLIEEADESENFTKKDKLTYKKNNILIDKKKKTINGKEEKILLKQKKIKIYQNECKYLSKNSEKLNEYNKNIQKLNYDCKRIQNDIKNIKTSIDSISREQNKILGKANSNRKDYNEDKIYYYNKISIEENNCSIDIERYTTQLKVLENAHDYAVIKSAPNSVISNYSDSDTTGFSGDASDLKRIWEPTHKNLSNGFYNKVIEISKRINCDPNSLMAVMQAESGITTTAQNEDSNAIGLIQFMPKTAKELGTSTEALRKMRPEQQLVYVEKYLQLTKKRAGFKTEEKLNQAQLYMLVFSPKYAKCSMNESIYKQGSVAYKWNRGLDRGNKGYITMADLNKALERHKPKSIRI